MKNTGKSTRRLLPHARNQRGIAIILAIFAMVLAVVIAVEIAYETQVEYLSASQTVNRLKAYYAAKAGVELALFRILIYKQALANPTISKMLKDDKTIGDMIWRMPFSWPPTNLANLDEVNKDQVKTILKESLMDSQFLTTVEAEGGKIDINDLGSPSKELADGIRAQILQIFENEKESNKAFKEKYDNYDFSKLIDNIQDWVDEDKTALGGGDESQKYDHPQDVHNYDLPPNAPFKTLAELHMVKDMEDEFFDLLKNKITVYGTKGINVNYADTPILQALNPQIKDQILTDLLKRRADKSLGGPFEKEDDFYEWLESKGVRTADMKKAKLPLLFDAEYNFRIVSSGQFANVRREITAVTYDIDGLTTNYAKMLDDLDKKDDPNKPDPNKVTPPDASKPDPNKVTPPATANSPAAKPPKGRPTVVFWRES